MMPSLAPGQTQRKIIGAVIATVEYVSSEMGWLPRESGAICYKIGSMAETGSVKHQEVRAAIMAAIRSGEFQIGHRLPSERELAERFGVSYMTARRAVSEMVEAALAGNLSSADLLRLVEPRLVARQSVAPATA